MMKLRSALLLLMSLLVLAACSSEEGTGSSGKVEVTLPPALIVGRDTDEVVASMEKYGEVEAIENEDGSLTLKMTDAAHEGLMKETEEIIQVINDTITSDEMYMSLKEITHNDAYDEFTVKVDKEAYESSRDRRMVESLGLNGTAYQVYSGEDFASAETLVIVIDEATGEEIHTYTYPEEEQ